MSTVLENVPKEMILIFKTNDLLRGLETTLDVRPDANAFITMSELVQGGYIRKLKMQIETQLF